jgi:hypothetical protein
MLKMKTHYNPVGVYWARVREREGPAEQYQDQDSHLRLF